MAIMNVRTISHSIQNSSTVVPVQWWMILYIGNYNNVFNSCLGTRNQSIFHILLLCHIKWPRWREEYGQPLTPELSTPRYKELVLMVSFRGVPLSQSKHTHSRQHALWEHKVTTGWIHWLLILLHLAPPYPWQRTAWECVYLDCSVITIRCLLPVKGTVLPSS